MEISEIISTVRNYPGVRRKGPISKVIEALPIFNNSYLDLEIVAGYGDDSAGISHPDLGDVVLLLAADGIMESLIESDPYWAGYASVLVNVNDIAAMGGVPMAMVNILSCTKEETLEEILRGIRDGCCKFGVPMVGGHTHPDAHFDSLSVSIMGIVNKGSIIYSHTAETSDIIVFAFDMDGKITPGVSYSWDTTSHKTPLQAQAQIKALNILGGMKITTSGKDMSNPGMLGTLGMLLETSGKGGCVDLETIPVPNGLDFVHWITIYQGSGFVLTCKPENYSIIEEVLEEAGLTVRNVGEVTDGPEFKLQYRGRTEILFNFSKESITGIKTP